MVKTKNALINHCLFNLFEELTVKTLIIKGDL